MRPKRKAALIAMVIGFIVGAAYPFVDVWLKCRAPESEACVWGKAFLPLTVAISVPLLGAIAAGVAYAVFAWRSRDHEPGDE